MLHYILLDYLYNFKLFLRFFRPLFKILQTSSFFDKFFRLFYNKDCSFVEVSKTQFLKFTIQDKFLFF